MRQIIPILSLAMVLQLDGVEMERVLLSVSHYTDSCGVPPIGVTASGVHTAPGVAACGPSFPFGSTFLLDGGIVATCYDRGRAISDSNLDLWVRTEAKALRMGRYNQWATVIGGES